MRTNKGCSLPGTPAQIHQYAVGMPDACPRCGESRAANPGLFAAGQTLCLKCADTLHEQEQTMEREWNEGRFSASRYHTASRLLSAGGGDDGSWEWSHTHTCPECHEPWTCSSDSCEPGPMECPTCEELIAAESVPPPEGYVDRPLTRSDLAVRDLGL